MLDKEVFRLQKIENKTQNEKKMKDQNSLQSRASLSNS